SVRVAAHRDPTASPTRRSSDLKLRAKALVEAWIPGTRPGMTRRLAWRLKLKFDVIPALVAGIHLPNATVTRRRRRAKLPARAFADRKSTRLNSSHVKMSYAVCC